jgi:arylsulfatase B
MVVLLLSLPCVAERPIRPNIVLIVVDDLGFGELGCQGNAEIPTPRIDSIARDGIRFASGYVTASFCSPSRAGLLTGRNQNRFGYDVNPVGAKNDEPGVGLPGSELTLAEQLKTAGYATGLIGKWHLGGTSPYHPLRHGFDEFFGFLHEGHFYSPSPFEGMVTWLRRRALPDGGAGRWVRPDGRLVLSTHLGHDEPAYDAGNPILRDGQPVPLPEDLTDALSREAASFIHRHADRPFFLAVTYNAVHSPMQASVKDVARFPSIDDLQRRVFAGMLAGLDDGVGQVLDALRSEGLDRRTLVFLLSDNGGPTRELTSSNLPLRGGKGDLHEGGIRVPFLARWAGTFPAGAVEDRPVSALDIFPTVSAVAGVPVADDRTLDGTNLVPYLMGEDRGRPHEVLWWRMGSRAALRSGDWKLVGDRRGSGEMAWELYDLATDEAESVDLADDQPRKVAELAEAWHEIEETMAPPTGALKPAR